MMILKRPAKYLISKTDEYQAWFDEQQPKVQAQIEARLRHIECDGYFGICNQISAFVWELKWKCGRRVYFAYLEKQNILLLLGGNKNGQQKDINQAKKILDKNRNA